MTREFLKDLGLEDNVVDSILSENAQDIEKEKQQTADLQAKYDADTGALREQLAEHEYTDAISRSISGKGLKFSSKAAERDFIASLREKKLELKDGELTGLDDFITACREADPDAFASDKPVPRFVAPAGTGGAQAAPKTVAEQVAETIGRARAESGKTANDVISKYTGGKN